jgi:hypothetical protein
MNPTSIYTNELDNNNNYGMPAIIDGAANSQSEMEMLKKKGFKIWQ